MASDNEIDERTDSAAEAQSRGEDDPGAPVVSWEADLDVYPVRERGEDPGWAITTVWLWVGFALASLAFIVVLLILGAIYT